MARQIFIKCSYFLLFLFLFVTGCSGDSGSNALPAGDITYNVDANGIPRFAGVNYIELDKIYSISRFRSGAGHDYSDSFETCRSMKHYFNPKSSIDWATIKVYSPVKGKVSKIEQEWAGTQIQIKSDEYPAFTFIIFHVNMAIQLKAGDPVAAGQQLGTHIGSQTQSDIAVSVITPGGMKLVSYFDVMTDQVFSGYRARGLNARTDAIITKEARDADPLSCNGDSFASSGNIENWVTLN